MIITIDGPVASGKSTIARMLAQKLHFFYLNTGSLYRALAYAALQKKGSIDDVTCQDIEQIVNDIAYAFDDKKERIYYKTKDITSLLETPEVSNAASRLSTVSFVRAFSNHMQRSFAENKDCVIDGRDSGSVVFADAEHKFFVTASDEIRAGRWQQKQNNKGCSLTFADSIDQVKQRDQRDSQRKHAPMIIPADATVLMNEGNDPHVLIKKMCKLSGL